LRQQGGIRTNPRPPQNPLPKVSPRPKAPLGEPTDRSAYSSSGTVRRRLRLPGETERAACTAARPFGDLRFSPDAVPTVTVSIDLEAYVEAGDIGVERCMDRAVGKESTSVSGLTMIETLALARDAAMDRATVTARVGRGRS